jgi:DNA-binding MarR family transcriptional regulator
VTEPLSETFWAVARRLRHLAKETVAPFQITPGQSRALDVLFRTGSLRLSDLSEKLHIAPRSTTEVVDALEERGFVERQPDPSDRRATLAALTADGEQAADALFAARRSEAEKFFGDLSDGDRVELARILSSLLK